MSRLRFRISMSLDGFVAGPRQSVENPLGIGGMRLHEWVFPLQVWRAMHDMPGGEVNASSQVVEESIANIGATVMGRNMFGGPSGCLAPGCAVEWLVGQQPSISPPGLRADPSPTCPSGA
jgi:hypothetical protein